MERELCADCVTCFEQLLNEPLGSALLSQMNRDASYESCSLFDHFFQVRHDLMKNHYNSPQDFLNDFNQSIEEIINKVSKHTEFAICLSYFQDNVNNKMKAFLPGSKEDYIKELSKFKNQIKMVIPNLPDDLKTIEPYIKKKDPLPSSNMAARAQDNKPTEAKIPIHEQFDLQAMKSQIGLLLTDEDSLEVTQIIMNHEPYIRPNENGDIEIDLHKCMPYTLGILKNLLDHTPKANPPPIPPPGNSIGAKQ